MDLKYIDRSPLIDSTEPESSDVADDHAIESGNIAASSPHRLRSRIEGNGLQEAQPNRFLRGEQWMMNYQEAAIYLEEGVNNEKFDTHPKSHKALPAYLIAHHPFFHVMDLFASLLLLSLAIIERPAVQSIHVPIIVHATVELLGIFILTLDLIFKARWQGIKTFFQHKRSLLKCILLLVMVCEAITVIVRQANHFRVTRALRPLFLLDTHYCRGIRRFCRQLLQSLPPILELLFLLLFVMLLFSILGFYLFSSNENCVYFLTLQKSFISLFVLLTTANYPDVMMPSYATSNFSAIFFIVYIAIELYFFMNLFLAVVYNTFTTLEKSKVKKLLIHKRNACEHAFRLLVSKKHPEAIALRHFVGLMHFYMPRAKKEDVYLIFKSLNTSATGCLSLEEFFNVYSLAGLNWKEAMMSDLWFHKLPSPFRKLMTGINWLVTLKWFEYFIYCVITGNFIVILYEAIDASIILSKEVENGTEHITSPIVVSWHSIMFTAIYILEALLKILGLGPKAYFTDGWNLFDLIVTLVSVAGLVENIYHDTFFYFIILRPFRLIRIFKARRRYRDVLGTLFILADRLWSLVVTLVLLFYFYGIIGMECFSHLELLNCCQNSTAIAPYYANSTGYYYLNNFDDIFKSGVTLFELLVVNNWFIIMEGYAIMATEYSRIYFMTFYLITMVVMTVVVAFILEAFMFKIEYRHQTNENSSIDYLIQPQSLSLSEVHMINNVKPHLWSGEFIRQQTPCSTDLSFVGKKKRGKIELSQQMYKDEIEEWLKEGRGETTSHNTELVQLSPPDIVLSTPSLSRISSVASGLSDDVPCIIDREDDVALINHSSEII
ncbi:two pore channel protein 1-like [Watersipora subatra]|uniref:two pore channel protein 1-like n=1 Tax=Watersipora subatra TaxID=2589382 RepID=UPI00355C87E3